MWRLENVESSNDELLHKYCTYFSLTRPTTRKAKIIAVASVLKERALLTTRDGQLLAHANFVKIYTQPEEETLRAITNLFPYFQGMWITLTQASALLCMQTQTEPFATYLAESLSSDVIRKLCSKENQKMRPNKTLEKYSWQSIITQSLLALRAGDNRLVTEVENSPLGTYLKSLIRTKKGYEFIPSFSDRGVWEQAQQIAKFYLRLNAVYSYSLQIEKLAFQDYTSQLSFVGPEQFSTISLLDYLSRNQNDMVYNRMHKKLIALTEILDQEQLFLKSLSLRSLFVDEYENIWVLQVNNSHEVKTGMIIPNLNKDTGIATWDAELYAQNFKTFRLGYQPEEISYLEDEYEEDEENEVGEEIDLTDITF